MSEELIGGSVLITGGTGSVGQALIDLLLASEYKNTHQIYVFSRDEMKQHQMRNGKYKGVSNINYILGDVRDYHAIKEAIRSTMPSHIVHAAAMKHIPACEIHPGEAYKTNVVGAQNLIRAVKKGRVADFDYNPQVVGCSTDKAASPTTTMGASKFMMERLFLKENYSCVRYGNLFGSRGSVFNKWVENAKTGEGIELTHKDMTRYVNSLSDSAKTIVKAFGSQGSIIIKPGISVKMLFVAESINSFFGNKSEVKIVGVRPNEKMHEDLLTEVEYERASEIGAYDNKYWHIFPPGNFVAKERRIPCKTSADDVYSYEETEKLIHKMLEKKNDEN